MRKIIKKLHSIFGLVFAIPLILIGITGALLSFRSEIVELLNPSVYNLKIGEKRLDTEFLVNKIATEFNATVTAINIYDKENKPLQITLLPKNGGENMRGISVRVNPYTGEILPDLVGQKFFGVVTALHRNLLPQMDRNSLSTQIGRQVVAIATIFMILFSLTGLYLYYKPMVYNIKQAMKVDFKAKGKKFYYKLHAVFGVVLMLAFLIISVTGLTWSYQWVRGIFYYFAGVQMSTMMHGAMQQNNAKNGEQREFGDKQDQGEERKGRTKREQGEFDAQRTGQNNRQNQAKQNSQKPQQMGGKNGFPLDLSHVNRASELFKENFEFKYFTIRSSDKMGIYTISFMPKNSSHSRATNTVEYNFRSDKIDIISDYSSLKFGEKVVKSFLPLHTGEFFGLFFKIIFCFASAFIAVLAISGYLLWKKPKRKVVNK